MKWIRNVAWPWIKRHWKVLLAVAGVVAAVVVIGTGAKAIVAAVVKRRRWRPSNSNPGHLDIMNDIGNWIEVELDPDIDVIDVTAAGISSTGDWAVEVRHEATNRRGDPDLDDGGNLGISG